MCSERLYIKTLWWKTNMEIREETKKFKGGERTWKVWKVQGDLKHY